MLRRRSPVLRRVREGRGRGAARAAAAGSPPPTRRPPGFEFADIAHDLFGEFARYVPPGRVLGAGFGQMAALAAAGFTNLEETDIRVGLPVPDAETFWAWIQTHGSRHLLDELDEARRAELRRMTDLEARDRLVLRRYAWLFRGRVP